MRNCVEPGADRVTLTEKLFAPCSAHLRFQCVITVGHQRFCAFSLLICLRLLAGASQLSGVHRQADGLHGQVVCVG